MATTNTFTSVTNFFKVSVLVEFESDKGMKHRIENYIVEASTPTEVETIILKEMDGYAYRIKNIALTNIAKIL